MYVAQHLMAVGSRMIDAIWSSRLAAVVVLSSHQAAASRSHTCHDAHMFGITPVVVKIEQPEAKQADCDCALDAAISCQQAELIPYLMTERWVHYHQSNSERR